MMEVKLHHSILFFFIINLTGEHKLMENKIGNSTTVLNSIILMAAGIIFGKWGATLLQMGIDQTILTQIISFIVFTAFAYINAKYHNTLFGNNAEPTTINASENEIFDNDAPVLNDEYIAGDDDDAC